MKIEIYDPAMCCSTGVCGPSVDPELVRIQEALRQIQKQAPEVIVERYGLSNDPQAFVANASCGAAEQTGGSKPNNDNVVDAEFDEVKSDKK